MPTSTFFNLSDEKKKTIFDSAVQEFSARRFSEASINQIVKNAGIARGSFYQYFTGKEDLYLYMVEQIARDVQDILGNRAFDPNAGFMDTVMDRARDTLAIGKMRPEYTRIGALTVIDNSEFMLRLLRDSNQMYAQMIENDKQRGLIKQETDSEVLVKMIYIYIFNEYLYSGSDESLYFTRVENAIRIIKEGVAAHTG